MRFKNLSLRKAAVAVLLLHLLACALIALGCWLNPTQLPLSQPSTVAAGKPAPRVLAQRTKSYRMLSCAHAGHCYMKPAKK